MQELGYKRISWIRSLTVALDLTNNFCGLLFTGRDTVFSVEYIRGQYVEKPRGNHGEWSP